MNKLDEDVGTGLVGAPACGEYVIPWLLFSSNISLIPLRSVMKLQIRVDDNGPYLRSHLSIRAGLIW